MLNTISNKDDSSLSYDLVCSFDINIPCRYLARYYDNDPWQPKKLKQAPDACLSRDVLILYRQHRLSYIKVNTYGFFYCQYGRAEVKYEPENLSFDDVKAILSVKWGGMRAGAGRKSLGLDDHVMRVPSILCNNIKILTYVIANTLRRDEIEYKSHQSSIKQTDIPKEDLYGLKDNINIWLDWVDREIKIAKEKEQNESKNNI